MNIICPACNEEHALDVGVEPMDFRIELDLLGGNPQLSIHTHEITVDVEVYCSGCLALLLYTTLVEEF